LGCPSAATKLAGLKANYNGGNYSGVLGKNTDNTLITADEVIQAAIEDKDKQTLTQAEIIKARAQIGWLITNDKFCTSESCPKELTDSIILIKQLHDRSLDYEWMRIEMAATVADASILNQDRVGAFYAYNYLINNFDFTDLDMVMLVYVSRLADSYEQVQGSRVEDTVKKEVESMYKKTITELTKNNPTNIGVIYAQFVEGLAENSPDVIPKAILARAFYNSNKTQYAGILGKMDKQICDLIHSGSLIDSQKYSYSKFLKLWEKDELSCQPVN